MKHVKLFENFLITEGLNRPTEEEINKVVTKYKTVNARAWDMMARDDFYSMAQGYGDPSVMDNYYPGWVEEDFKTVIELVDGEYEP